jgi:hypothetical protein
MGIGPKELSSGTTEQFRWSLRRWVDVLVLTSIAFALGCILLALPSTRVAKWMEQLHALPAWLTSFALFTLTALFVLALVETRVIPTKLRQLTFIHLFPPVWLAVLVGLLLVIACERFGAIVPADPRFTGDVWRTMGVRFVLAYFFVLTVRFVLVDFPRRKPKAVATERESISRWLQSEAPVASRSQDQFNRDAIVNRLTRRLLAPLSHDQTIGLIGEFGSGKTSIVRLTRAAIQTRRVRGQPHIFFCEFSCWGFDDASAMLQSIMAGILIEIAGHVDCVSIQSLPSAYRSAMAGGGGPLSSIANIVGHHNPTEQLQRLSSVLLAVGARLVIALEDLDRQDSTRFDPQEVLATLHRLRSVRAVSFILTGSVSPGIRIDFAKLCDHIEEV